MGEEKAGVRSQELQETERGYRFMAFGPASGEKSKAGRSLTVASWPGLLLGTTDGGDRTHTHLRELDFESSASANSATSAFREEETCNPFAAKRKRQRS